MIGKKHLYEDIKLEFEQRGYDLISSEYVNCKTKLKFICKEHLDIGIQEIDYSHFSLRNQGCKHCNTDKAREISVRNLIETKGYVFVRVYLENKKYYVEFICPIHKEKGIQKTTVHCIQNKHGCKFCGYEQASLHPHPSRTKEEDIIQYFNTLENVKYLGFYFNKGRARVKYECSIHKKEEVLEMDYNNILRFKFLCEDCRNEAHRKQTFIEDLYFLNKDIEILSEYLGDEIPVICRCKIHNITWSVTPCSLIAHPTCPKCRKSISTSEKMLGKILNEFNIKYSSQKRYVNCKDKKALPFDFYLIDYDVLIEYQGEQHYKSIRHGSATQTQADINLKITQKHDKIKTKYCKDNNIPLICIPYWEKDDMEYFLFNELVKLGIIDEIESA